MSKKSFRDYFNVAQLGPDHVDDNPGKLNARVGRYQQELY